MCTLIVLHRCVSETPLVVAANRDEFFDRPAEGPALRDTPTGKVLAPRDERAGGTWLGLNEYGLFAAVTNRRSDAPDPNRRSRGLIVLDALGSTTAREAADEIQRLPHDTYNPFNLVVADGVTAHVFSYLGSPERIDLAPGAHVVGNVHPDGEDSRKIARLRDEVAQCHDSDRVRDDLADICRSHAGESPFEPTCVHAGGYGTRSSTLLRLGKSERDLFYAGGAPCAREYDDFTPLLEELGLGSSRAAGHDSARKIS
jgi:uncharacterized protein with NRDE domain